MLRPEVMMVIAAMAAGSYVCRSSGFFAMRYVRITPRVEAALKALPIALVTAVLAIAATHGGPPEWAALTLALVLMAWTRNELIASLAGVLAVALLRAAI